MKRRDFIALGAVSGLGISSAFGPAAWAQQPGARKRVGLLFNGGNPDGTLAPAGRLRVDAVRAGLKEEGFIDGMNVTLDVRIGLDAVALASAAKDLASGGYDVLVGSGTPVTAALLAATKTIPIVFVGPSDPLGSGFVESFARPGGNATGFTNVEASFGGKWLDILHQAAPEVRRAVLMSDSDAGVSADFFLPSFRAAAGALGIEPGTVEVRSLADIEAAIADMARAPGTGLVVSLKDHGFVEGSNVIIDVRFGNSDSGQIRAAARDLANGGYDVLVGFATVATAALLAETKTTPIVFITASDPIGSGFVQSFARPGGNVTGFTNYEASLGGKWLEVLRQVAPAVRRAVMIFNPDTSLGRFFVPSYQVAAATLGIEPAVTEVRSVAEMEAAIADAGRIPGTGIVMGSDTFVGGAGVRRTFIDAVARQNLPASYPFEDCVLEGGLISYGIDLPDIYRRSGGYVGLILQGTRPADLPVQAPTKFALSVNLKTAKAQGITIPTNLVALADKVIE